MAKAVQYLKTAYQSLSGATSVGSFYFLAILTLVMLVCTANRDLFLIFLILALAFRGLVNESAFWLIVAMPQTAALVFRWGHMDNHQYLFAYWCLALALSTSAPAPLRRQYLAINARLLIGLCMGMAVVWKLLSPDYLDGSFFTYSLLTDPRFAKVSTWIGGMTLEQLFQNREALRSLQAAFLKNSDLESITLQSTSAIVILAQLFTVWTLLIEIVIAATFLAPNKPTIEFSRNVALITFIVTTYMVAPVVGFGWIITLLGIAQCRASNTTLWQLLYLSAFILSCVRQIMVDGIFRIL